MGVFYYLSNCIFTIKWCSILDSRINNPLAYHGTTTLGLICVEGVVFSTDTRVTMASYIAHKKGKKIYKIDEHLGMTVAGTVADAQNVVDILRYYASIYKLERKIAISIKASARLASNIFFSARMFPYITNVLIGGYDSVGASIFNVDLFGTLIKEKYVSTGSGSPIAYGILESEYRDGLTIDEGIGVAVRAVNSAMRRDTFSGDNFDVVVIDKDGYKELLKEEKKGILAKVFG